VQMQLVASRAAMNFRAVLKCEMSTDLNWASTITISTTNAKKTA